MKIMKRKITLFILAALVLWTASAVQAQVSVSVTYAGSTAGYTDGNLLTLSSTNRKLSFLTKAVISMWQNTTTKLYGK